MAIICRMRRDEHDGERWTCAETQLVWICDVHIVEWMES